MLGAAGTAAILSRAFVVWLAIIAVETMNGIVRELLISPIVGEHTGRRISFAIAILLIMAISLVSVRWIDAGDIPRLFAVGILWASLTFLFEATVSLFIAGRSWSETMTDFNPYRGGLMTFGLLFLALVPVSAYLINEKVRR